MPDLMWHSDKYGTHLSELWGLQIATVIIIKSALGAFAFQLLAEIGSLGKIFDNSKRRKLCIK